MEITADKKISPVRISSTAHRQLYALKAMEKYADMKLGDIASLAIHGLFSSNKIPLKDNITTLNDLP